jgi:fatty-acyl-CoA synthase
MFDGDLLSERARISPDRLALVAVESGERLTYGQLDTRVERAAATLRALLAPGERFGILAYNCVEFVELFFAAGRAGVIAVPLSTRATAHELQHIVDDCAMRLVFCGVEFENVADGLGIERRALAERVGDPQPAGVMDGEATYCLLYTSGTTGKPKGVMIPRRQLWWNGYNTVMNWGLREDDVTQVFTPMYHAGGLAVFLIPLFACGGTVVLHRGFDVREIWRVLQQEKSTVLFGVPTIWKLLLEAPEFATADLSHVRWMISGGAPLPQNVIDAWQARGVVFKQGYGMTEVGVNCFTMTVDDSYRKPGSIGRPMTFTEVRLVNPDAPGELVAEGEVGEMWIRGPHVSSGYWNDEAATRASYLPGGWFRTGDLARRDADGCFYIAGRRKEMFISGGVNVYPVEIEAELVSHPGVSDAAVVALADETWGEIPIAFVVAPSLSSEVLTTYLGARLAKYKIPKRFVFVEALPRTPYGKVLKTELVARLKEDSHG